MDAAFVTSAAAARQRRRGDRWSSSPPADVRRAFITAQANRWSKPRRVVAKVEWHQGEPYPRVGFIVTNLTRPAERVSKFYNGRGTAEQWIKIL
jgi:Transposase DDE domain group 1